MNRFVVVDDTIMGRPVYVAADEADASRYLKQQADILLKEGKTITFDNSLTMRVTSLLIYRTFRVVACPSWEPDPTHNDN